MSTTLSDIIDDLNFLENEECYTRSDALKILKIEALVGLSVALRDCFESSNRVPSISEAIVMAAESISQEISGLDHDL